MQKEEEKKVVYVVVEQGKSLTTNYKKIYHDSQVVYVYCHDVDVSNITNKQAFCQLFSLTPLPDRIDSAAQLDEFKQRQIDMVSTVLRDEKNTVIIWAFPLKVEHYGVYVGFIHSMEIRNKYLVFHLTHEQMIQLCELPTFNKLNRAGGVKIMIATTDECLLKVSNN